MTNRQEKLLISVEEACQILSIGKTRAYELIKSGQLRTVKLGVTRRVLYESVREFVAALTQQSTSQEAR
jgi:excisionase family DNA binding protein